jgi:hypothetical protein
VVVYVVWCVVRIAVVKLLLVECWRRQKLKEVGCG